MIFLILTFLILVLAFYQWQYHMVFTPTYYRKGEMCERCSLLSITTDNGIELEGAIYEPQNIKSTLLVFVGRSHDGVALLNKLSNSYPNTRIVAFNYRSYGKSEGVASEKNILSDGLKIAELVQKNYGDYYILGFSLGSSVGAFVASKHKSRGIFLVGAFDSIASLAKSKFVKKSFFPNINISFFFRYKFHTALYVKNIEVDTYLFVSKDDEVTYINNARNLKSNVNNLKYYLEVYDLSHKEILWDIQVVSKIREVIEA